MCIIRKPRIFLGRAEFTLHGPTHIRTDQKSEARPLFILFCRRSYFSPKNLSPVQFRPYMRPLYFCLYFAILLQNLPQKSWVDGLYGHEPLGRGFMTLWLLNPGFLGQILE